jgi:hypothetical protein
MSFETWFQQSGYDEQHRAMFEIVWNAALHEASEHVIGCEGTDFNLEFDLKA